MTSRWHTQDRFYEPEKGLHGNCQQAATAALLGLPMSEVPNFFDGPNHFWRNFWEFVHGCGYAIIELSGERYFDCLYLAYGPSARGCDHAVIYKQGKLHWDPHPTRAGLLEVTTCCLLVPQDLAQFRRVTELTEPPP